MKLNAVKILILIFINILTQVCSQLFQNPHKHNSLVLLHVLFRHGHRTANGPEELYPNDPYQNESYFPTGLGQLTNAGKNWEFSLGRRLRNTYDTFLGPYYYPKIVDARSTNFNRTKASLQLVLAGLFPPRGSQVWNMFLMNWQPVPYNYYPVSQDDVLAGVSCPNYLKEYEAYTKTPQYQSKLVPYTDEFESLTDYTGKSIADFNDVYNLFFGLATEEEYGFILPEWTKNVWPETITNLAIKYYFAAMGTTRLRQIGVGYFLQKIIADSEAKIQEQSDWLKIYLYSAHENNVAEFLLTLDIFNPPHVPTYGAYIVLEVHKMHINNTHGIKIYYQNYKTDKPQLLKLKNCEEICEIAKFKSLLAQYMPTEGLCGNKKRE